MFSTMMTDESTMMPKSTAPIDSRFADLPRRNSTAKANSKASGMLMATISALRLFPLAEQHQALHLLVVILPQPVAVPVLLLAALGVLDRPAQAHLAQAVL